jgi:hypothetical protein
MHKSVYIQSKISAAINTQSIRMLCMVCMAPIFISVDVYCYTDRYIRKYLFFVIIDISVYTWMSMRINQLPVSVIRWQNGSQICFMTFITEKSQFLITEQQLDLEKKLSTDLESLDFVEKKYLYKVG